VACDATARLYDVDEKLVVFKRLNNSNKYDQGEIVFRARKGALVDLGKLHESLWATRLSGGTRSGIVSLNVTSIGEVSRDDGTFVLHVSGTDARFVLKQHSANEHAVAFRRLQTMAREGVTMRVSGVIDQYVGRWPTVLKTTPKGPRIIRVTKVEAESS